MLNDNYPRLPLVRQLDGKHWLLCESFKYDNYIIPSGFISDGASVPRGLWSFMSPNGKAFYPAIIHDFLYSHFLPEDRKKADAIFKLALVDYGMGKIRANMAFSGVRVFGGLFMGKTKYDY